MPRRQPSELRIEYHDIDEIVRWPKNPKGHDFESLEGSFKRFGFADPMVRDDKTGMLVVGNGRSELLINLRDAGKKPPKYIRVENGKWFAPVVCGVSFKNEGEARAYLLAENKIGELGGWDQDGLNAFLSDLADEQVSFDHIGFDPDDIIPIESDDERDEDPDHSTGGGHSDNDDPDEDEEEFELPEEPVTKTGDVWQLGDHRLMCGDSTKPGDVNTLVQWSPKNKHVDMILVDPPFAIYGSSTGIGADIADDKMVRPFFEAMFRSAHAHVKTFGHVYVCCDWRSWAALIESSRRAGMSVKNCIVWDKGDNGLGTNYQMCHEFIGFFVKLPPAKAMKTSGRRGQRTVLGRPNIVRHGRVTGLERLHNAAKPVDMLRGFITAGCDEGGTVLDLYGGSGSTLIAAEIESRVAYLMEIEPKFCDVIVARWEKKTGKKAVRHARKQEPTDDSRGRPRKRSRISRRD